MLISISGTIGVGKSTLCQNISDRTGFPISHEPVANNPYLTDFYGDPSRWGFHNQAFILATLYSYHREFVSQNKPVLLLDRSFYEGKIFVEVLRGLGHFSDRDYETYNTLYQSLIASTAPLDLIVYLKISPEEAMERIQERGRESEKAISLDYMKRLDAAYDQWVSFMSENTPVRVLDWSDFGDTKTVLDVIRISTENLAV